MHPIPLVDLKAQYDTIAPEIEEAIARVLDTTAFIMGPDVAAFEAEFAAFCGTRHSVGVASGTAALHLALHALGVGPGDEVVTVPHTFFATAEAIIHCGARPIFVDVDPVTYTLDPEHLAAAVTPHTKAILPVHLYGQCADADPITTIAAQHGIPVVEDAAQAHGARYHGRMAGSLGRIACFSFYPGKNLGAYGDGGALTTDDDELATTLARLRNHGRSEKYLHRDVGFGERLDALQAAVLRVKLRRLAAWTEQRQRLAARYDTALADRPELILPAVRPDGSHAYHLYVVRTQRRDDLLAYLKAHGVRAGIHYPVPLHLQPALAHLGHRVGAFPVTEALADSVLSLPLYPEMTDAQLDHVVETVRDFFEGQS